MAVMKLTEEMYQKEVMETDKKVVIDFWADIDVTVWPER